MTVNWKNPAAYILLDYCNFIVCYTIYNMDVDLYFLLYTYMYVSFRTKNLLSGTEHRRFSAFRNSNVANIPDKVKTGHVVFKYSISPEASVEKDGCGRCDATPLTAIPAERWMFYLKVHKRENFLGFDFEICTFS